MDGMVSLFSAMSFAILITFALLTSFFYPIKNPSEASSSTPPTPDAISHLRTGVLQLPKIYDFDLKIDIVFRGLDFPTSMAFLGPNDILVLEKNKGTVQRIINGERLREPLLDVNVSRYSERGMLGIGVERNENEEAAPASFNVFIYFTESLSGDGDNQTLGNLLYKYELADNDSKLVNPKKLLDLSSSPGPAHNGGRVENWAR
jgi:aldose sugar dehydrogenase